MSSIIKNGNEDRRGFPRISIGCPVLYRVLPAKRWQVATLMDYSAIGIRIVCDDNIPSGSGIAIQIKPGSQKTVPKLSIIGIVLRCETNTEQHFEISCKITKIYR